VKQLRRYRLGVDIGGTFTDLILLNYTSGELLIAKTATTPDDPAEGVIQGVRQMLDGYGALAREIAHCVHATTLVTNALIERKGARVGLLTTAGFRDVLEIAREIRYDLYDLFIEVPEPLVRRRLRLEVGERVLSDGTCQLAVDPQKVKRAVRELAAAGVEALAIVFLHSYLNSVNEEAAERAATEEIPGLLVSSSYRVARELREYERTSTTVANAYVQPTVSRYIGRLSERLREMEIEAPLSLMNSSGGLSSAETAQVLPVTLVESGPAAGALIGGFFGRLAGEGNVLAFDMGGTTAKACLVDDGVPFVTYSFEAGRVHRFKRGSGLPLKIPAIDLIEIGAGGGSIAGMDRLGLLKVGPESAGAKPGPACYGLGGDTATVTDADLLLGYLRPDYFLGGAIQLQPAKSDEAVNRLAGKLGLAPIEVCWGIHDIVTENMASAARVHIAERGRDPRKFVLVATGGAGPVHGYGLARKLQIGVVLCPLGSGVASTLGLLVAPPRVDLVHAYVARLRAVDWHQVNGIFGQLRRESAQLLGQLGVVEEDVSFQALADLRYVGQGFEVLTTLPSGPYGADSSTEISVAFETTYRDLYERTVPGLEVEAVNWRLRASGPPINAERVATLYRGREPLKHAERPPQASREVYFPDLGGFVQTSVYDRYLLTPGDSFSGPAIVEERESTVVVGPDADFHIDEYHTLVMTIGRQERT
jgi:N-methylhydantoinase A